MGYKPKHMAYSPKNELAFRLGMAAAISTTLVCATPAFAAEVPSVSNTASEAQTAAASAADTSSKETAVPSSTESASASSASSEAATEKAEEST